MGDADELLLPPKATMPCRSSSLIAPVALRRDAERLTSSSKKMRLSASLARFGMGLRLRLVCATTGAVSSYHKQSRRPRAPVAKLGSKPNRLLRWRPLSGGCRPNPSLRHNSDQAGGDGLWYVVRVLRWEPIWKAFEKRCGYWRAGSEAGCRSANCLWLLEYLATTSLMCSPGASLRCATCAAGD